MSCDFTNLNDKKHVKKIIYSIGEPYLRSEVKPEAAGAKNDGLAFVTFALEFDATVESGPESGQELVAEKVLLALLQENDVRVVVWSTRRQHD